MKLRTIAEIATILAFVIAFLQYADFEPNALDRIPDLHKSAAKKDVENLAITIDEKDYEGEKMPLYLQYKAAIAIPEKYSKDSAIEKVVSSALQVVDFKLAVAAAKEMEEKYSKSSVLEKIVAAALSSDDEAGYAIIAAELIPEKYSKSGALEKIVKHYQAKATLTAEAKPLSQFEKYKIIYSFADAPAYMDMSSEEARAFAENWLKTREYSQFNYFKLVFEFADAPAYLNMNSNDATSFALKFIDSYTEEEFLIYQEAFEFADAPANMNLSTSEAMVFAKNKLTEYRDSKKSANNLINRAGNTSVQN